MAADKHYYITTTLPYVNADPHIGFALEIVQADVLARFKKLQGYSVFFNFGTDEHGQKIYQKALEEEKDPKAYVDEYAKKFDRLKKALNLTYNSFIRTTEPRHIKAAQEMWNICTNNGFISKGTYHAKYCVGCELEKTDSELVNGKCELHPSMSIQIIKEENYFFKFSKFQDRLLKLYKENPEFVVPKHRLKEIRNFVSQGLQDFSVSRLKEKMPWGIPVPNDDKHVMYVWFDALTNYISSLGWPEDHKKFETYWGTNKSPIAIQMAGKDNLRQQSAMWQAMLIAADLPSTKQIFIHGFITSNGQKMSKSLGNVIDPFMYVKDYGTDAVRYFLLGKLHSYEDSDFTKGKFEDAYDSDLANGLGNLISRVSGMIKRAGFSFSQLSKNMEMSKDVAGSIEAYKFDKALTQIWGKITKADVFINQRRVWSLKGSQQNAALANLINQVRQITKDLEPFMPETANEIRERFHDSSTKTGKPLFPRLK